MRPIATDTVAWSVGQSIAIVSHAKSDELSKMPFGTWTQVGPRNHVLHVFKIPTHEFAILGVKREKGESPGHAKTCLVLDILKPTQQVAKMVQCMPLMVYYRWGTLAPPGKYD